MALFDGSPVMEVVRLDNGYYGVRCFGGNMLGSTIRQFVTQNEAEEWVMSHTAFARAGSGILKPGCGQNVA